ncbi:hypothetical protein NPIL_140461 [Nephila pilipes]|uniref:Uncharacterized protein n=1 Tax=Nephila pilipes TaxID=299642 RepID=A0A8X6NTK1_NEPPI|nr:hypothetical protein NPIL_140461 [Nephila pilipes]
MQHLIRFNEDPAFVKRIVKGRKSWCHHHCTQTKQNEFAVDTHIISFTEEFKCRLTTKRRKQYRTSSNINFNHSTPRALTCCLIYETNVSTIMAISI